MVIVDTSVIIDYLRQTNKIDCLFYKLISQEQLVISIVTYAELFSGKSIWESAKANQTLQSLCDQLLILPISPDIARQAGKIKSSHNIDLVDCLIAATAVDYQYPLATINLKHFQSIPSLHLYKAK